MAQLNCPDYFNLSSLLSEEEIMIQNATRDFVDNEVLPIITEHHRQASFPADLVPKLAGLGYFGANVPAQYGGAGLNNVAYGLALQELERGDSGVRSMCSVQTSLVMYPILQWGSEEQKNLWLPKLAKGEAIGCFGLTEPDFGSDPGGLVCRATRQGDKWILNGQKMWITNGTIADLAIVWAKDDNNEIRAFLVEKNTPGFSAPETKGKWSLRASVTSELILDDVKVSHQTHCLEKAVGLKCALACLNQARYGIAWGALGTAMNCYETALNYAKERIQFDQPIARYQITQEKLVWMLNEITKGQFLVLQLGRLKDAKTMKHQQVSLAKRNNVNIARKCTRLAREILGAAGIVDDYPIMRHMMNIESVYTYEGTHDMHTLIIGADITGFEAYRVK
ncbi:MAG: acyl-CoA dehydrogenase family protein [Pseudomonadota bacterium]